MPLSVLRDGVISVVLKWLTLGLLTFKYKLR